jgi:Domain of unknown function (DUF6429)
VPRHWEYDRPRDDATNLQEGVMDIDNRKVDEITLALLYLTTFKDKYGLRAWKSHSRDVLNRLHEGGYIHDPVNKAKSVMLTEEGAERSKRLFEKHFTRV